MYRGLLTLGGKEIANSSRCASYLQNGLRPISMDVVHDDSWPHTARSLGQQDYRLPHLDLAPWYDPTEPDSKDFAGIWPMSITGLDSAEFTRETIEGLNDGGTFGLPRYGTRPIIVEALLIGRTSQAVDYGLRWLSTALRGYRCAGPSMGEQLMFMSSAPFVNGDLTAVDFEACIAPYRRTMHEVVCTKTPEITERFGAQRDEQACGYRVTFELTAGVPYAYRQRQTLLDNVKWTGAVSPIVWVVQEDDPEACLTAPATTLVDPTISRATMIRPTDSYQLGTIVPIDSKTTVLTVPAAALKPAQGDTATTLDIVAGAQDERLIRIRWGRKAATGMTTDNAIRCYPVSEASIAYLPAGATLSLDGVTGRAWATDSAGNRMDASPVVAGRNGGPWKPPVLYCGDEYVIVADAPGDVSAAAFLRLHMAVRES